MSTSIRPASGADAWEITGKGSYILVLRLDEPRCVDVGKLGRVCFPPGVYLYFGSALNGLNGRIKRHLRREKKVHWHIDNLTLLTSVEEVWWVDEGRNWECAWANETAGLTGRSWSVAGFGSSDCGCGSHLHALDSASNLESLRRRLQRICGRRFKRHINQSIRSAKPRILRDREDTRSTNVPPGHRRSCETKNPEGP